MRFLVVTTLLAGLLCSAAQAYDPNVGDRAANIYGRDVISDSVVHLDDYLGSWVFLDFWASWCGPCIGEMPNLLEQTKLLREQGELDLFSVSLDAWTTTDGLHEKIAEFGIDYPVLFDGGGWDTVMSDEWNIHSIPAAFLINPQGVIVATNLRGENLGEELAFFMEHGGNFAPVGLETSHTLNDDGSVVVDVLLTSPQHKPLLVDLDYHHMRYIWAEDDPDHENRPVDRDVIIPDAEEPEESLTAEFGMFGDTAVQFTIPAVEDTHYLYYYITVQVPGSEALNGGEGIWVMARGSERLAEL